MGTITGVHRRKAGVVRVEYRDNPELYEVARGLLFPTPPSCPRTLGPCSQGQGESQPPAPPQAFRPRTVTDFLSPRILGPAITRLEDVEVVWEKAAGVFDTLFTRPLEVVVDTLSLESR